MIRSRLVLAFCATALAVTACGGDAGPAEAAGQPGDAASADRTIKVAALDTLVFDPPTIDVAVGETITFQLDNAGTNVHEFTLGTQAEQDDHEEEMSAMSGDMSMDDDPNAITLEPGSGGEITWTFTEPGTYQYACHTTDHYAAGMFGTITVTG